MSPPTAPLQGKTILLLGASGGIGQALAQQLDKLGASLIITGRHATTLQPLAESLQQPPQLIIADLVTEAGLQRLIKALPHAFYSVIFAAGLNDFALLQQQDPQKIVQMLNLNLLMPMLVTQALLPKLNPDGRLLYVGSSLGAIGYPGYAAYGASKAALRNFVQALKRELADQPLQLCHIAPRATQTGMNSSAVQQMNLQLGSKTDSPNWVAAQIVQQLLAVRMHDEDLGFPEKFFIKINALLPAVVDNNLRKQLPVIKQFARQHTLLLNAGESL